MNFVIVNQPSINDRQSLVECLQYVDSDSQFFFLKDELFSYVEQKDHPIFKNTSPDFRLENFVLQKNFLRLYHTTNIQKYILFLLFFVINHYAIYD